MGPPRIAALGAALIGTLALGQGTMPGSIPTQAPPGMAPIGGMQQGMQQPPAQQQQQVQQPESAGGNMDYFPDTSLFRHAPLKEAWEAGRPVLTATGQQEQPKGSSAGLDCRSGVNVFMLWPATAEMFLVEAYGTLESVLFHYPDANVYVYNMPVNFFDRYQHEGYCVSSRYQHEGYCVWPMSLEWANIRDVLWAGQQNWYNNPVPAGTQETVFSKQDIEKFLMTLQNTPDPPSSMTVVWNAMVFGLQYLYGGVFVPLDGLMVGTIDMFLETPLSNTPVFLERILPEKTDWGLVLEEVKQPRSPTDLADGETGICCDWNVCIRHLPKEWSVGREGVMFLLNEVLSNLNGNPDTEKWATLRMRHMMRSGEMALLPHWVLQEPTFADGYKANTGVGTERDTELYSPRFLRAPSDWMLVSTAKLWMPLRYGSPAARNTLKHSVMDAAYLLQAINIAPFPYKTQFFNHDWDKKKKEIQTHHFRMGLSDQFKYFAQHGINETILAGVQEGGYPGTVGGFRTFGRIRIVGRPKEVVDQYDAARPILMGIDEHGQDLTKSENYKTAYDPDFLTSSAATKMTTFESAKFAPSQPLRVKIILDKNAKFYCRNAAIPNHFDSWKDEAWYGGCQQAIQANPQRFDLCGTASQLNSVIRLLGYRGNYQKSAVVVRKTDAKNEEIREKIGDHYGNAVFTLYNSCQPQLAGGDRDLTLEEFRDEEVATPGVMDVRVLKTLLDDPEQVITVAAHSASRCWMMERLADSLVSSYPKLKIIGTCECAEDDPVCDQTPRRSEKYPEILTIFPVPYDFGLSQGKTKLTELTQTDYTLILDDDFVRTHHTCIECMLAKMYSNWHTSFLPLDLVGFPVQEDERNFGAYRGRFRQVQTALYLEPFTSGTAPDGCVRVEFCPMVYLARTARMREFKWKKELKVGEHEYFFYTNKMRGIQTGVCFDSSFAHARHKPNTALASYQPRRDRFLDLMMGAFAVGGITRVMYLFRTYQMTETSDFDELADREVAPWDISDDTCGPSQEPLSPFVVMFAAILSMPENVEQRMYLRTSPNSWISKLKSMGNQLTYTFVVPADPHGNPALMREQAMANDMIFAPSQERQQKIWQKHLEDQQTEAAAAEGQNMNPKGQPGDPMANGSFKNRAHNQWTMPSEQGGSGNPLNEYSGGLLRFIFEFLRKKFMFRWLFVLEDQVHMHLGTFLDTLHVTGEPVNRIIGRTYTQPGLEPEKFVDGTAFVLSRDLFGVLTQAIFLNRAQVADTLTGTLNRWLMPFEVEKIDLPHAHFRMKDNTCPLNAAFLHPVNAEAMRLMDANKDQGQPPCMIFYDDNELRQLGINGGGGGGGQPQAQQQQQGHQEL